MQCTVTGEPYTVFGYGAKQVRDHIHSADVIRAFDEFFRSAGCGEAYNMAAAAIVIAQCWKRLSCARESPENNYVGSMRSQTAGANLNGGSATSGVFASAIRNGGKHTMCH